MNIRPASGVWNERGSAAQRLARLYLPPAAAGQPHPQHIQNLVIRDHAKRHGLLFKLSATEYVIPGCYMMLEGLLEELPALEGIIAYSLFMLPPQRTRPARHLCPHPRCRGRAAFRRRGRVGDDRAGACGAAGGHIGRGPGGADQSAAELTTAAPLPHMRHRCHEPADSAGGRGPAGRYGHRRYWRGDRSRPACARRRLIIRNRMNNAAGAPRSGRIKYAAGFDGDFDCLLSHLRISLPHLGTLTSYRSHL